MDIEQYIFNVYKDQPLMAKQFKQEIIEKYHVSLDKARDIFVKINNYQIKKYGEKIDILKELYPYSKEDLNNLVGMLGMNKDGKE